MPYLRMFFVSEQYLSVLRDSYVRSCYTNFRIRFHRLEKESGRYKNTPISERLCKMCNLGKTESEFISCLNVLIWHF
jgi:hypothetical protein